MTRLEKAARAAAVAVGDDPDREGEPITAYIDLARAVLMAVRVEAGPSRLLFDTDVIFNRELDAILNEGQP